MKLDEYIKTRGNVDVAPEELDKLLGVKVGRQKPKYGDGYWYINNQGLLADGDWCDCHIDNHRYYTDNCFLAEEDVRKKLRVIQTEIELRKYAEEHNEGVIDWTNSEQYKWYLNYDFISNCIDFGVTSIFFTPYRIYFTSKIVAMDAVNEIGKERVTEYLKYGSGIDD